MKNIIYTCLSILLIIFINSCSSDDNEIENNPTLAKHISLLYDQSNPSVVIDSTINYLSNGRISISEHYSGAGNVLISNYNYNINGDLISIVTNGINPDQFFDYNTNGTLASVRTISPSNGFGNRNDFVYLPNRIEVMYNSINTGAPSTPILDREFILNANGQLIEQKVHFIQDFIISMNINYNGTNNIESRTNSSLNLNTMVTTTSGNWDTTYTSVINPVNQIMENTYGANLKSILMPIYLSGSLNYDFPTRLFSENIISTHNVSSGENWPMDVDYSLDSNGNVDEVSYTTTGGTWLYVIKDKFFYQ
ncbi:MAG: hypothetical protein ACSHWW_13815 [Nonlabens sp.]|uniref:hypothetical protein n=1 Tax=Nonlabens sp. TaxID=1888209 RepID=UPI003EF7A5E1